MFITRATIPRSSRRPRKTRRSTAPCMHFEPQRGAGGQRNPPPTIAMAGNSRRPCRPRALIRRFPCSSPYVGEQFGHHRPRGHPLGDGVTVWPVGAADVVAVAAGARRRQWRPLPCRCRDARSRGFAPACTGSCSVPRTAGWSASCGRGQARWRMILTWRMLSLKRGEGGGEGGGLGTRNQERMSSALIPNPWPSSST